MCNIIVLLLALSLVACRKENSTKLNGTWKLVAYHNLTTSIIEKEPADVPRPVVMQFSDNGSLGTITGHTVTNKVSGNYRLRENNGMETLSFGGTKVGEPRWGQKFWDAIYAATAYQRQGNRLFIFFAASSGKMEFKKE